MFIINNIFERKKIFAYLYICYIEKHENYTVCLWNAGNVGLEIRVVELSPKNKVITMRSSEKFKEGLEKRLDELQVLF